MQDESANNKRVAKNTLLLYFRMILMLIIGLYTSRIILQVLGVEDYGIHSVIAGFLTLFGIITGSMSSSISRFITVELGKNNKSRLKTVFSTSLAVQIVMGLIVVVAICTIGFWFIKNKMTIPNGREDAAEWCLFCATITTFIGLMNVPFNSCIVAHEKMSAFAYMTIFDASMKLAICYIINISPFDKLKTYTTLLVVVSFISTSIYWIYSLHKFEECQLKPKINIVLFKEIFGFAGWSFFGQSALILNTQGVNMLMNVFFGVVINSARGIADQVNGILQQFVTNFMMALNPQITKSYAAGDKEYAFKLACRGARYSFFIMYLISLPIMIESHEVLEIWLGTPPEMADKFLIWTIITSLILMLGNTLTTLQLAHGNIRHYQVWITLWAFTPFPLTWIAYEFGLSCIWGYILYAIVYWLITFVRFYLVNQSTGINAKQYLLNVVLKCHIVAFASAILPIGVINIFPESTIRLLVNCFVSVFCSILTIYYLGMEKTEKEELWHFLKKISSKLHK